MRSTSARNALLLILIGAVPACLVASVGAEAGRRFFERKPEGSVAVAHSRFGNGSISGPVRRTRVGYDVRKPNGTWVACRRSCAETLRVETIDFYERDGSLLGQGFPPMECGIFGCLDIHFSR